MSTPEHGTYAAYQRHHKAGETPCADCRRASADYAAERRERAGVRREEMRRAEARRRALMRLADMHPALYRALYEEELAR